MANKAEIVITALDKASATINRISDRFEAMGRPLQKVQESMGNVQKAFGRLGESTGISKAGAAVRTFGSDVTKVALTGTAAITSLGLAFIKFEGQLGGFADAMANAGVKGQGLVHMRAAADAMVPFGVNAEDASAAMIKLAQNQSVAKSGNEQMIAAFAAAGISVKQLRSMKADELFAQLSENFSKSEKSGAKLVVATTLMGKSSTKMVEAMSQGPEALSKFKEKYRAALLSDKDFDDMGAAGDKLDGLGFLFNRIGEKLSSIAAPKLTPLLDKLEAKLLAALPGLLEDFSRLLDKINEESVSAFLSDIGDAFQKVASVFQTLHSWLGTTGMVFAGLAALFAPTIAAVASFAVTVGGPLIGGLVKLGTFAFPLVGKAFAALSAMFAANPIVMSIALISTAAFLLYKNWDTVVAGVKKLLEGLGAAFSYVMDKLPAWLTAGGNVNVNVNNGGAPSATQAIAAGGSRTEVGGRIQLEVTGAPVKVKQLSSDNNAVPIDVNAGLYGYGA